ncbi:MAG: hypothetical protein ACM3L6_06440, partial [Deltaproteobacteria bacterium]
MKTKGAFLVLSVFLLAVLCVYGNTLGSSFIWDDHVLVQENASGGAPFSWGRVFTAELYPAQHVNYFRPLVAVSFFLNGLLGGAG